MNFTTCCEASGQCQVSVFILFISNLLPFSYRGQEGRFHVTVTYCVIPMVTVVLTSIKHVPLHIAHVLVLDTLVAVVLMVAAVKVSMVLTRVIVINLVMFLVIVVRTLAIRGV